MPQFEFHIARATRAKYQCDATLFALSGNVILANARAARLLAQKMNAARDLIAHPDQVIRAGQLNAMGLIDELLHYIVAQYRQQINPRALADALAALEHSLGKDALDAALAKFADEFPNVAVYRGEMDAATFLAGSTDGVSHRQIILEEMLLLWLANENPAFAPFLELFDDTALEKSTAYQSLISNLDAFFQTQPPFGPDNQNLIDLLRAPALASPHSLEGQLEFIRARWLTLIGKYLRLVLIGLDLIKEETRAFFLGAGPARAPEFTRGVFDGVYDGAYPEYERFSRDLDWMPRLVLIAKSTYVWLDQLSKKYQRAIARLDQIPDEELDLLARRGFTGLWLIGVWQRSPASKRIKELCGAPNAEASAYSVYEYRVADDLGGDGALENLKARAWQRGIRLASDMVPNHMGIDSRWVSEHPDWFIASDYAPFPSYTFNGENLSRNPRVGIFLEDHYFSRSDAAVVFQRVDFATGDVRYIYHGNDGTSFPWNDTAQLNFLQAQVREAVIQTILRVARQFPIIRLDAAMTLAKRHYQRLWFPPPGSGGDIPSRAEFGLTKEQFDAAMPEEFWREVVDRVAAEAPETLLLAEAFWLMEGYFVRTLGMHRVYNSAFMVMLRDEENAKYRSVIKNTLEFDPEILKRYVNFLNNPDEKTAVDQFGKGDKYFGVATMMATLPGLPMFGHGQIEGFAERYGMEFRRALWDEPVDAHLVERHTREIFPLLHRRHLFAGVENFLLYDFFTPHGAVNEDVFAYSNRVGGERALVVYHNKYADTRGWIRASAAYLDKASGKLIQKNLGEGLEFARAENVFVVFCDQVSELEYIRPSVELGEQGLYIELGAYQRHVFLDFREVCDDARQHYARLCASLNGRGVPSVDDAAREIHLQPIHQPFRDLVNAETLRQLLDARDKTRRGAPRARPGRRPQESPLQDAIQQKYLHLVRAVKQFSGGTGNAIELAMQMRRELEAVLQLGGKTDRRPTTADRRRRTADRYLRAHLKDNATMATLIAWVFVHALGRAQDEREYVARSRAWLDEWWLGKLIAEAFREFGLSDEHARQAVSAIRRMTAHQQWYLARDRRKNRATLVLDAWFSDDATREFLGVNLYKGIWWFNKESFESLLFWTSALAIVSLSADTSRKRKNIATEIVAVYNVVKTLRAVERKSKYQVDKLRVAASDQRKG
ncbi:MAG: alpha-amylase [Chloroflexi bacterium]|nr:alpha-amylase [Chloroflexota bacterium]